MNYSVIQLSSDYWFNYPFVCMMQAEFRNWWKMRKFMLMRFLHLSWHFDAKYDWKLIICNFDNVKICYFQDIFLSNHISNVINSSYESFIKIPFYISNFYISVVMYFVALERIKFHYVTPTDSRLKTILPIMNGNPITCSHRHFST